MARLIIAKFFSPEDTSCQNPSYMILRKGKVNKVEDYIVESHEAITLREIARFLLNNFHKKNRQQISVKNLESITLLKEEDSMLCLLFPLDPEEMVDLWKNYFRVGKYV